MTHLNEERTKHVKIWGQKSIRGNRYNPKKEMLLGVQGIAKRPRNWNRVRKKNSRK